MSDGGAIAVGSVALGKTVVVSRLGYKSKSVIIAHDEDGKITLDPEPVRLSIHTSDAAGAVSLDGKKIGDLEEGAFEDGEIPPDGNQHKLSVDAYGKPLFTINLEALKGAQPQISSVDVKDVLVITGMGNQATVYGGKQTQNVRIGEQGLPLSSSGTPLTVDGQNPQITYRDGVDVVSIALSSSTVPTLTLQSLNAQGQIQVPETTAKDATLKVDGLPVPRRRHGWIVSRPPGSYTFEISAMGYEPYTEKIAIQRRQVQKLRAIVLKPVAAKPVLADLVINNATPGAAVDLDGKRVGRVDSTGTLTLPMTLSEGNHKVVFSKPEAGLESRTFELAVKPPAGVTIAEAKLGPSATVLTFETNVSGVTVKYRQADLGLKGEVAAPGKIPVPPGEYQIDAGAPGYKDLQKTVVVGKEPASVVLALEVDPFYYVKAADQVVYENQWFKARNPAEFVPLRPGLLQARLIFATPGKILLSLRDKKVEWIIELPQHAGQIDYSLRGDKLTRKVSVGKEAEEPKDMKVSAQAKDDPKAISVHVRVDGASIRISNDKGEQLDEFTAPKDFSHAQLSVKSDSRFMIRRED